MFAMGVLEAYRKISVISREMLKCANEERWDELQEAERRRADIAEKLQAMTQGGPDATDAEKDEIRRLIGFIQACDKQTIGLTRNWMVEVEAVLGSIESSRKLKRAYRG